MDKPNETLINGKSLGEYYLVFSRSAVAVPFIKKGFSHVWAVKWDGFNWIAINPVMGYTDIFILPCVENDIRVALADVEYTDIIHVIAWRKIKTWRTPWPSFFSCVEQVKALIGIRTPWVITPWQLYRHLGGSNGRLIQQAQNTRQIKRTTERRKAPVRGDRSSQNRGNLAQGGFETRTHRPEIVDLWI